MADEIILSDGTTATSDDLVLGQQMLDDPNVAAYLNSLTELAKASLRQLEMIVAGQPSKHFEVVQAMERMKQAHILVWTTLPRDLT